MLGFWNKSFLLFQAFSGKKVVTVSKQECFGLERIGIFPIIDNLDRLPHLRLSLPLKPGFHMIVGDRSRSLGSLTIAGIASKVFSDRNDHMETKFSFCQRSPTIPATANDRNDHDRWDRIRVYLCDRSDRERSSAIAKS